ncbi:MAG: DNRLRE domain-containing protein, partial [Woeseiaceae bacterium]|nr:DNRLRE domain-containing protein [Woeseiaceae bacterium]
MSDDRIPPNSIRRHCGSRSARPQRGYALVTVMVAAFLVAAVAYLMSQTSAIGTDMAVADFERDEARYVAEAGIEHALWLAHRADCADYASLSDQDFGNHAYTVTPSPGSGSPISLQSIAVLDSGATATLDSSPYKVYASNESNTLLLQPDASAGKDAWLTSTQDSWNYGSSTSLNINATSQRILLQFDLSAIPANARIEEAQLELYAPSISGSGNVAAYRITDAWIEGSCSGSGGCPADGATWATSDGTNPWLTPGGDIATTPESVTTISGSGSWQSWNVGSAARKWHSGMAPNNGLMLASASSGGFSANFLSSDDFDAARRPKLTITYSCECGQVCAAPNSEPRDILLVVGDPLALTPEQTNKVALMEGWGHTVTLIAASESQAVFDSEASAVDVVYVPELGTSAMTELGSKADDLPKGVITEEARKPLMLGSFALNPFVTADSINITDNSHHLTETLPIGSVPISGSAQSMWVLRGTLATDLHVIGELGAAEPALAYVDTGELRNDDSPSPARRVKLPWGAYEFDVSLLTDEGREIMRRAIEWAAVAPPEFGQKNVLFVVGNVGGPGMTSEELAHKSLIESWGHTVAVIDDDASQAEYDAAVADSDVVFTTNDITANRLGTKVVDATIGVVTSEVNLSDEFGMASTVGWDSGTALDINDNTHYITSPFSVGVFTILSSNESLAHVSGTLSPDLGRLASTSSGFGV